MVTKICMNGRKLSDVVPELKDRVVKKLFGEEGPKPLVSKEEAVKPVLESGMSVDGSAYEAPAEKPEVIEESGELQEPELEVEEEPRSVVLKKKTVKELKSMAKDLKIKGYYKLNEDDLINAIILAEEV